MTSTTSKTQFKLPGAGARNLKVEAKKLAGDKASYTWLVGTQKEQKSDGKNIRIYRSIEGEDSLMTWLHGLGVPLGKDSGDADLLSYTQQGDRPIALHDFVEAFTFSFSDPWGKPKTSDAVVPPSQHTENVDMCAIQKRVLELVKSAKENNNDNPAPMSCLLLTFATFVGLMFSNDPEAKSVPWQDERLRSVRGLWNRFETAFAMRDKRLRDDEPNEEQKKPKRKTTLMKRAVSNTDGHVQALNAQMVTDFKVVGEALDPLLNSKQASID